jgi:streptogramin lyase
MLFGTANGLSRYGGSSVKVYRHDPDNPNSLSHNNVRALHADRRGVVWVYTNGGGLNKFDPQTENFTHYRHDPAVPNNFHGHRHASIS